MIESGIIVGLALLFSMAKMSWHWKLRILSNPLLVDLIVLVGLLLIHWGTFTGVMAATIGAMIVSLILSAGRLVYGYMEKGKYVRGYRDVSSKL